MSKFIPRSAVAREHEWQLIRKLRKVVKQRNALAELVKSLQAAGVAARESEETGTPSVGNDSGMALERSE